MSRRATTGTLAIVVVAEVLALLRIIGASGEAFQATAHLYVGGLIGAYAVGRRPLYLWTSIALSAVELACFILFKGHP